jgi:hypothetical protein
VIKPVRLDAEFSESEVRLLSLRRERNEVRVNVKSPLILAFSRKGRRNLTENIFRKQNNASD